MNRPSDRNSATRSLGCRLRLRDFFFFLLGLLIVAPLYDYLLLRNIIPRLTSLHDGAHLTINNNLTSIMDRLPYASVEVVGNSSDVDMRMENTTTIARKKMDNSSSRAAGTLASPKATNILNSTSISSDKCGDFAFKYTESENTSWIDKVPKLKMKLTRRQKAYCRPPHYAPYEKMPAATGRPQWLSFAPEARERRKYIVGCKTEDWGSYVMREFYYLLRTMRDKYNWIALADSEIEAPGILKPANSSDKSFSPPLAIFFCEVAVEKYYMIEMEKLRAQGTLILAWGDDLHMYNRYSYPEIKEIFTHTDVMVSTYAYRMETFFAPYTKQMLHEAAQDNSSFTLPVRLWSPHSASPEFTERTLNDDPIPKIFLSGAVDPKAYPLRYWLRGNSGPLQHDLIDVFKHPGYVKQAENQSLLYAMYMRSYEFAYTSTMSHEYLVAKVFEIPATGALLLVNLDLELVMAALGMKDLVHYVGYHSSEPTDRIYWALDPANKEIITEIRHRGQELMRKHHTPFLRAKSIDDFVTKGKVTYQIPSIPEDHCPCPFAGISFEQCVENVREWSEYRPGGR